MVSADRPTSRWPVGARAKGPGRTRSARPSARVGATQLISLLLTFVLLSGLGGVLAAGLVMPGVASASVLTDTSVRLFDDLPEELETVALMEQSRILAADGTLLATFYYQNRTVVPLEEISQPMQDAVVAIEDHRFFEHGGVDLLGMARALFRTASGDLQGASTLTQQYVKNALIQAALAGEDPETIAAGIQAATTAEGSAGIARKLQEAKLAIALEQVLTKEEILERYLNIAQFGLSVYGVEAAAQYYFSIHASELDFIQAATIAGVTQAPTANDPVRNPEASEERRNVVLATMRNLGYITTEEYETGIATPLVDTLVIGQTHLGCMAANAVSNSGYFCDFVTKIIANDPAFGETRAERARLLYRGGLTITTTLDTRLQAIANAEVLNGIPVLDPSGVASAISVVEPGTGHVVAMAQNRIYNSSLETVAGETSVNYNTDNQYGGSSGFAPGSTFKPFTLMQFLRDGHGLSEMVDGSVRARNENEFVACGGRLASRPWNPGNADGGRGFMTVLDATRNSVNNAYLDIGTEVDLCSVMEGAADIGVHRAGGQAGEGNFTAVPANVLGSDSVAPLTMAAAFAAFAANGVFCEPIAITSVVDSDGSELPVPDAGCHQAISPEIAAGLNYALSQVWSGTASSVGGLPGRTAAGKTGTTSENEYTWFVGYTPQLSTAVWVGFPDAMVPVQNLTINGTFRRRVYGSTIALPTWKRFMVQAHQGLPVVGFPPAGAEQLHGRRASVPDVSNRQPEDAVQVLEEAGFHVERNSTTAHSDVVALGRVIGTSPAAGTSVVRGTVVTLIVSLGPEVVVEPPEPEPTEPPEP